MQGLGKGSVRTLFFAAVIRLSTLKNNNFSRFQWLELGASSL